MLKGTGNIVLEKGGLRFSTVKGRTDLFIDQYGRVFERGTPNKMGFDSDGLKCVTCGHATH